uniref:histidine kinase n=1 Tax=Geobacter metallireducens TaxID=28232 RepID=A0A831XDA3_GEOME
MGPFRHATIKRKLILIGMATTGAALLVSGTILIVNEMVSFRRSLENSLTVQTQIIGSNCTAALTFSNATEAGEILGALKAAPNIVRAIIYTPDGEVFAGYARTGEHVTPLPLYSGKNETGFFTNRIVRLQPIMLDGEQIGTIRVESDLQEFYARLRWHAAIMALVFSVSLCIAFLLLARLQRTITGPILDLVGAMGAVSRDGIYSVRATIWKNDELGALAQGFNEMLMQIQSRDSELEQHRRQLEQKVTSRTVELAAANQQLQHELAERRRAEEKLQRYSEELRAINEEIRSFAYIVSHDLRAPLINIKGFAAELELVLKDMLPLLEQCAPHLDAMERERLRSVLRQDAPEALGFISSSVNRMDSLINAVLKLSYLGRRELTIATVSVGDVVDSIIASLQHQMEQHNATVSVGELPEIAIDRTALEQIIGNLLDNAVKYLKPGRPGHIQINAYQEPEGTIIRISDNGRGIAPKDMGKIFELFRRANCQDTHGEGMGLAYVKTLVRRLGGRIECESALDSGTTFNVFIPRQPP